MTSFLHPSRWACLLVVGLLSFGAWPTPATAAGFPDGSRVADQRAQASSAVPVALVAGIFDGVVGNRSRMIQFAFIGFAIGVGILMTSTRKH